MEFRGHHTWTSNNKYAVPGTRNARATRPSAGGSFPDDRRHAESLKRSRYCGFLQELKDAFQQCIAPDGDDIGMPRAGNLDEAGRVRKGCGKSAGLAACDEGVVAAVNDEHGTVHPRRDLEQSRPGQGNARQFPGAG